MRKTPDLLTASRMTCLQSCPRKHFWRYETGLKTIKDSDALRFGSAWHTAMEARATGADCEGCLIAAIGDRSELDEIQIATLSGMLAAYWTVYQEDDHWDLTAEIEFQYALRRGRGAMRAAGVIDGIIQGPATMMLERKTTAYPIDPGADYWLQLRGNKQVLQYLSAAFHLGWNPEKVFYDVVHKPTIRPHRSKPVLDEDGLKIVLNEDCERIFNKDGSPKQSADKAKGQFIQTAPETPEQYGDRVCKDATENPSVYFARKEIPILINELEAFTLERSQLAAEIQWRRRTASWPRSMSTMNCRICEFSTFCLQDAQVDIANPPAGFVIGPKHAELKMGV